MEWHSYGVNSASSERKTVAYLRVSTLDQGLERNKTDILHFANHHDPGKVNFVEEIASGKKPWRDRQIAQVLEELRNGDAIIVAELSKLGLSMLECMEILALATRKSIRVYSVKGSWQLDNSIQSKIIALAFSMAAEIERDLISQRTREELHFKKEQGLTLGRPKGPGKSKLDVFRPEIENLLANGATQRFIAQRYHTAEANHHNWLKKNGIKTVNAHPSS
ncbi:MAG: recombinase family protein [Methylococcales bacterium]|nr:recombinase family protein [Methylococcales bacterium]